MHSSAYRQSCGRNSCVSSSFVHNVSSILTWCYNISNVLVKKANWKCYCILCPVCLLRRSHGNICCPFIMCCPLQLPEVALQQGWLVQATMLVRGGGGSLSWQCCRKCSEVIRHVPLSGLCPSGISRIDQYWTYCTCSLGFALFSVWTEDPVSSVSGLEMCSILVANATRFSHLLSGFSCGSKHLLLP